MATAIFLNNCKNCRNATADCKYATLFCKYATTISSLFFIFAANFVSEGALARYWCRRGACVPGQNAEIIGSVIEKKRYTQWPSEQE
jgi:hypothetical protein